MVPINMNPGLPMLTNRVEFVLSSIGATIAKNLVFASYGESLSGWHHDLALKDSIDTQTGFF